jgi:hypothetical protein
MVSLGVCWKETDDVSHEGTDEKSSAPQKESPW